jgi:hypothetical protein
MNHDEDLNLANRAPGSCEELLESRKQKFNFTGPHLKPAIKIHSILSHIHITVIISTPVLIVQDFQSNSCVDFVSLMRATFLAQPFLYTVKLLVMQLVHKSTSLIHQTQSSLCFGFPDITCCIPQLLCVAFRGSSVSFSYFLLFTDINEFHGMRVEKRI